MSGQSYLLGWLVYLAGAIGFLIVCWRGTRGLAPIAKLPLRGLLAALVLFPWQSGPEHRELAPAWLVTAFDSLFRDELSAWRAGGPLMAVVLVAALAGAAQYWRSTRRQENGQK